MREFASWKPYNKVYWETEAVNWFDKKQYQNSHI